MKPLRIFLDCSSNSGAGHAMLGAGGGQRGLAEDRAAAGAAISTWMGAGMKLGRRLLPEHASAQAAPEGRRPWLRPVYPTP